MMIKSKQIDKFLVGHVFLSGVTVTAANTVDASAALTTLVATAGEGGSAVPYQGATATAMGFVTSGNNIVQVWDATTGTRLIDTDGNEVYGRHNTLGTVDFFTSVEGTETAYTFTGSVNVAVPYRFSFFAYPADAAIALDLRYVANDPDGFDRDRSEVVAVTATDTLATLAEAPDATLPIEVIVDGVSYDSRATPALFTLTGSDIAWNAANAGFSIETTDFVVVNYTI